MLNKKLTQLVWDRDRGMCAFTGLVSDRLVIHHRGNRGMGGAKSANTPANLVLVDAILNGRFEDDLQNQAKELGFKISRYAEPASIPIFHAGFGSWVLLDDDGSVRVLDG